MHLRPDAVAAVLAPSPAFVRAEKANRMFQFAKEKLKIGTAGSGFEQTAEEGHHERKRFLSQIQDAAQAVTSASTKLTTAFTDFVQAVEVLNKVFCSLNDVVQVPRKGQTEAEKALEEAATDSLPTVSLLCHALEEQLKEFCDEDLTVLVDSIRTEVAEPLDVIIKQSFPATESLREERSKAVRAYDVARLELLSKEKEYQAKGRPISESKVYPQLVNTVHETQAAYESAAADFRASCDQLIAETECVAAQCLQASLHRTATVLDDLSIRLSRVLRLVDG